MAVDVFRTRGELACPKRITIVNGIPGGIPDGIPQFRVLPSAGYRQVRRLVLYMLLDSLLLHK